LGSQLIGENPNTTKTLQIPDKAIVQGFTVSSSYHTNDINAFSIKKRI